MAPRRRAPRSAPFPRSALAVLALTLGTAAHALAPPIVSIASPGPGRVVVTLEDGRDATGFNVYLDGEYRSTVRPSPGAGRFEIDGPAGTYCIVAFRIVSGSASYSRCSTSVRVEAAAPRTADARAAVSELRAVRYSRTAGEVMWKAPPGADGRVRYEIERDGETLGITAGRSRWEPSLAPGRAYAYRVTPIAGDGARGAGAFVELGAASGAISGAISGATGRATSGPAGRAGPVDAPRSAERGAPLLAAPGRARVVEGDAGGTSVELRLTRSDVDRGALRFSLVDDSGGASKDLSHAFDRSDLDGGGTLVRLNLTPRRRRGTADARRAPLPGACRGRRGGERGGARGGRRAGRGRRCLPADRAEQHGGLQPARLQARRARRARRAGRSGAPAQRAAEQPRRVRRALAVRRRKLQRLEPALHPRRGPVARAARAGGERQGRRLHRASG